MSEIVNTYLLTDPDTLIPMDREEFYAEQIGEFEKTGKPTRAVEIVGVFIFNSFGELLVQKRSQEKNHNPGLLDKSVGGHVQYGYTPDFSVMAETVQELQTPSVVLTSDHDFKKAIEVLGSYMSTIAIVKHAGTKIYVFDKIFKGKTIKIANKAHFYYGVYDGSTRIVDREAKGVLFYSLEELRKETKKFKKAFTDDLHVLLRELGPEMEKFVAYLGFIYKQNRSKK